MALPTDRDSFAQFVLRRLGEPVIKVNVALEQVDDCIDRALQKFYERHFDASELVYILYNLTDADVNSGDILMPPDTLYITDVFIPTTSFGGMFSAEYQIQLDALYSMASQTNFSGLTYYYMTQANISLVNRLFKPDRQFTYNPHTKKLIVAGGLKDISQQFGGVCIKAYRKIYGDVNEIEGSDTTNTTVANIWDDRWLGDYAVALTQKMWSENLSKFANTPLIGGVSLNADKIGAEADVKIAKCEEELETMFQLPPDFSIA